MLRYLIVVTGLSWRLASSSMIEPRIVGGITANQGEFPFYSVGTSKKLCGGSLIWPDVVLSAAHCKPAFQTDVVIGSSDVFGRDGAERILVDFLKSHEDYVPGPEQNDILLIKLQQPSVNPYISLNFDPNLPLDDEVVTVMGFGLTEDGEIYRLLYKKVDLLIVNVEECKQRLGNIVNVDSHICAGIEEGGKDSCDGDSGGPIVPAGSYHMVYGITSFGAGCARPSTPAVYTRVSYYKDWIESFICLNSAFPPSSCWGEEATLSSTSFPTFPPNALLPLTTPSPTRAPTLKPANMPADNVFTQPTTPPNTSPVLKQTPAEAEDQPTGQPANEPTTRPVTLQQNDTQTPEPTFPRIRIPTSNGYLSFSSAIIWLSPIILLFY